MHGTSARRCPLVEEPALRSRPNRRLGPAIDAATAGDFTWRVGFQIDSITKLFRRHAIAMGIRDRDYMKRPSDDDGDEVTPPRSKAEEFAERMLARSRKLMLIGGIALATLIIVALALSQFSGGSR